MAEENISDAQRQLTEAMAAVQRDLALFGKVTRETAEQTKDAEMKSKYGIDNFTAGTKKGADAVGALASAGIAAGKAMLDGKKGAAAFNSALDELTTAATAAGTALALLIPGGILIKGLIAGLTLATGALIKYGQAANEMADKLYAGFQGMAKSGAAASDGMRGLKDGAQKLGLSMDELNDYVQIVSENSRDLALMGGSVFKGRQAFEDINEAMKPAQKGFLAMGMLPKDIAEGTAGYLRTQTRLGNAQKMTVDQLAQGARAYLVEQDALTKLTGQTRKETEKAREDALLDQQFAATVRELQLKGDKDGAKRLMDLFDMANAVTPELGKSVKALATGNLVNEDAQKLYQSTQGQALRDIQEVIAGTKNPIQGMQSFANSIGRTNDTLGVAYGKLNIANSFLLDFAASRKLQIAGEQGFEKQMDKIHKDQLAQGVEGGKAEDEWLEGQTKLIQTQINANIAMTNFISEGITPAQKAMEKVARASVAAAEALYNLAHDHGPGAEKIMTNEPLTTEQGMDFGQLSGADGGVFKGPTSGYPVLMHGTEAIIPMDKLSGANKMSGIEDLLNSASTGSSLNTVKETEGYQDDMGNYVKRMLKDTETLTKLTDVDVKRTRDFNNLNAKYIKLKTDLMEQEVDLLEEQNKALEETAQIIEKSVGAEAAAAFRKSAVASRSMGGGFGGGGGAMGGGFGGGGGLGLKGPEPHEAVGSGGQGLKGPPKLATVRSKTGKSAEVNAEYAPRFQGLIDYLDSIGYEINSLGGYVDRDVRGKPGVKSVHAHGGAIDINPGSNPMGGQLITDLPENISTIARQMGLGWGGNWASIKDAMHFSVAANEGGDIKLSDGGVAVGPNSGYPATLHGEEAVIPLNNGGGNFVKLFENMASMMGKQVDILDELVRAQKNGNDISSKMLRMQS